MFNRLRMSGNVCECILQYRIFKEYCTCIAFGIALFGPYVAKLQMRMLKLPNVRAVFDRKKKSSAVTVGKVEIEITFSRTQRKILSHTRPSPPPWTRNPGSTEQTS